MSPGERELRSRLGQLLHSAGFLRGSLSLRERVCGKPNCKCSRGERHVGLYLVASEGGKPRQLFVPRAWEDDVREWVQNHHEARAILEEISELHRARLKKREV